MKLRPEPPFLWPEPRILEGLCAYEKEPPLGELVRASQAIMGTMTAITAKGIDLLENWLDGNDRLKISITVSVYPTCATRQADLDRLRALVEAKRDRLLVRIRPLDGIADRATNALCFCHSDGDPTYMVVGPSEDLGTGSAIVGQANLVFRADPGLLESFRRHFDWLWAKSRDIRAAGATEIPALVLPERTEEAARLWQLYRHACLDAAGFESEPQTIARVDPATGDVTLESEDGKKAQSPSEAIKIPKLDPLAERLARLYEKGDLVSIDKHGRLPPLDAPLDPKPFGDPSELQRGGITRKVSMRVSVIDETTLKQVERRRQTLRTILTKFSYGLADNMRWMPAKARPLFETELERVDTEGKQLIADLLKGDVAAVVDAKRPAIAKDIAAMLAGLGRRATVPDTVIERVVEDLKRRLTKAKGGSFLPQLSYSRFGFSSAENQWASPWGQAYSLLSDIAAFPRSALTDAFFFRGLKVSEDEFLCAMNVADDALYRDLDMRGLKDRCKSELELLSRIEASEKGSRDKCGLVFQILDGKAASEIEPMLEDRQP